ESFRSEVLWNKLHQQFAGIGRVGDFQNACVSSRKGGDGGTQQRKQWSIERSHDEGNAIGLAIHDRFVSRLCEKLWYRRLDRLHPGLKKTFRDLDCSQRRADFKDFFGQCRLEISTQRVVELVRVLRQQLCEAVQLINAPFIRPRNVAGEISLLAIEDILVNIRLVRCLYRK